MALSQTPTPYAKPIAVKGPCHENCALAHPDRAAQLAIYALHRYFPNRHLLGLHRGRSAVAEMTPRERVQGAVHHQEPDRVPLDIGGGTSTTVMEEGYEKLKHHLRVEAEPRILNKIFRMARLDEDAMKLLGVDCRPLGIRPPVNWTPPCARPGTFTDLWGITWRQALYGDGCYYWEPKHCPLAEATIEDLEAYPWPGLDEPGFFAGLGRSLVYWQASDPERSVAPHQSVVGTRLPQSNIFFNAATRGLDTGTVV